MQGKKFFKTKFPGVFFREVLDGKKVIDRVYYVNLPKEGGGRQWRVAGKHSEGVRPQTCAVARESFLQKARGADDLAGDEVAGNGLAAAGGMTADAAAWHEAGGFSGKASRHGKGGGVAGGKAASSVRADVPASCTFGEAVDLYCAWAEANGKNAAVMARHYRDHCKNHMHNIPVDSFSPAQAEDLKAALFREGLSAETVKKILYFLHRSVARAVVLGKARKNAFSTVRGGVFSYPRVDNKRERFLTREEAAELLSRLKKRSLPMYQMAKLSLFTGLRATEIFGLRHEDLEPGTGTIHIRGKTGWREVVHAPRHIMDMLLEIPVNPSGLLFPGAKGGRRRCLSWTFCKTVADMGIQVDRHSHMRITFHTLRHTFASWLAQSGKVTLLELKALMRHRDINMTLRYAHLIPSAIHEKVDQVFAGVSDDLGIH